MESGFVTRQRNFKNEIGNRYGQLLVVGEAVLGDARWRRARWAVRCDCGTLTVVDGSSLRRGRISSCGCSKLRHGQASRRGHNNRTYSSWQSMKYRCLNPNAHAYNHYGGRGITVCERWSSSFANFLVDMGERPPGTSLDRIDPNGNYEPANCRWATTLEQRRNQRLSFERVRWVFDNATTLAEAREMLLGNGQ